MSKIIRNTYNACYYHPELMTPEQIAAQAKYKVGDWLFVKGRPVPWQVVEIVPTGNEPPHHIGYWFSEQPLFPYFHSEISHYSK